MNKLDSARKRHYQKVIAELEQKLKDKDAIALEHFERKSSGSLGKIYDFLSSGEHEPIQYVEKLPNHNDMDSFIVHQSLEQNLSLHWQSYIIQYLRDLATKRKIIKQDLLDELGNLKIDTEQKKIIFLQHKSLHIKDLSIEDIIDLTHLDTKSSDKSYQIHRQNMYIGFLCYLHSLQLVLFPMKDISEIYYAKKKAQSELQMFLEKNDIYNAFIQAENENRFGYNDLKKKRMLFFLLYTFSSKITIKAIHENMFKMFDIYNPKDYGVIQRILNTLGATLPIRKNSLKYIKEYYRYIKNKKFKLLIDIFDKYMERKIAFKDTHTPAQFYKNSSSIFTAFLKFLEEEHPSLEINKRTLPQIFNYPDSSLLTYQEYLEKQLTKDGKPLSDSTKGTRMYPLVEVFSATDGYGNVLNKNKVPNYGSNNSSGSSRNPINDEEVIFKIDEIVTKRPPKSDYFRNHIVSIDTSWWKHMDSVRPFEPMIIKLHLRIPVRGATLRLIDRDSLLVMNHKNEIKGFQFKSDKNKNRRTPFIVPNIWKNDLKFLLPLIEYNKHYFPNLQRFYPDDTTLKEGIMPLFPNDDGMAAYKNTQHLNYWTKVLLQAEIEFMNEGEPRSLVQPTTIPIPKTVEEMEKLSQEELKTFKRKYDLHTLRHTGISRYINAGMPLELVRLLSGHSGFNTILTIYYHVNHEKLIQDWTEKHDIDFTNELDMHTASTLIIKKKIVEDIGSDNPENVLNFLESDYFFNLENRSIEEHKDITLEKIAKTDPVFWRKAANGCGICTKSHCPDIFGGRCSLCPYFVSNYLYLEEIGLEAQLSMGRVRKFSTLMIKNRGKGENYKNAELKQRLLLEIENFIGWTEVLALANTSYNDMLENSKTDEITNSNAVSKPINNEAEKQHYTIAGSVNDSHAYLHTLSQAFKRNKLDNEDTQDLVNLMAGKVIRYASKHGNFDDVEYLNNEEIIRWFLPKYERLPQDWYYNTESKKKLVEFFEIFDNREIIKLQGSNNENTFLTQ